MTFYVRGRLFEFSIENPRRLYAIGNRSLNKEFYDFASLHPHFPSENVVKFQKLYDIEFGLK